MNPLTGFWQNSVVIYCQPAFIYFNFILIIHFFYLPLCPFLAAKVRRLYDIANVLRSLKLIDKVHVTCEERGRKPAFEWVGPEDFPPIRGDFVLHLQSQHCATILNLYLTRLNKNIEVRTAFLLFNFFFYPLSSSSPPPLTTHNDTAGSPAGGSRSVLEPRPLPLGNCAKNLFPSPGVTKRGFTRHPSLIKMAKSIQDDRRKISSAPSSPAKGPLGE